MKRILLAAALCAVLAPPVYAGLSRIVSTGAGSVTVEFTIPEPSVAPIDSAAGGSLSRIFVRGFASLDIEGAPILPVRRFFFAVGASENVRLDILEEESYAVGGVLPAVALEKGSLADERAALAKAPALAEQRFVRLSGVEKIRGGYCAFVDVYPVLFDPAAKGLSCARRLVVKLSFPPGPAAAPGKGSGTFLVDDLVLNKDQAASWGRPSAAASGAARTPFEFSRSGSWVKIGVKQKGIYIVTYNDLLSAGANPAAIDPATLRLFSGGPYPEPDSVDAGGSFQDDYHFAEHAILYRGQGGGSLQPTDTVFFYGLPDAGWADDVDGSASPRDYYKHPYDSTNVYWLTWGGDFPGAPRRIVERDVTPLYAAGDTVMTWYEERLRMERDLYYDPIYVDDRWYWNFLKMNGSTSYFQDEFYTSDLADASGVLKTKAYGPYNYARYQNTATYYVNGIVAGSLTWVVPYGYNPSNMKTLEAAVSNIAAGRNVFGISKAVDNEMYVFWYEIFYHRLFRAAGGTLYFGAPVRDRRARYSLGGFPAEEKLLFDVTYDETPVLCTGWQAAAGGIVFEDSLQDHPRRYAAVSRSAFRKAVLTYESVPSLRDEGDCPDMVILYHKDFRDAALMLKAHRERVFPGVANPDVRAVDIEDVYNNFSGGHKDPVAIRNYLKFLYDKGACGGGGEPTLKYVLLLGNGTYDTRNLLGQNNDFVPLYINVRYPNESEAVEDEDFFVKLDGGIDRAPDLAIGRMAVLTSHEASAWAQRIVDYEERPERGTWRDRVILVADDEFSTNRNDDFEFLISTEELAGRNGPFPTPLDIEKVYLHVYPFAGDVKPAARKDFLDMWNEGALLINYDGHGSPLQMADERVMVNSDIYSLTNGMRRPFFLSFSCSVGDLDSPYHRSMAQNMTTFDAGGAIGTIAASAPTYLYPNKLLNETIYESMFTSKDSMGTRPVGYALQLAKYNVVTDDGYESNNSKYLLLGDPAMRLAAPSYPVEYETAGIDTMLTGEKYRVAGSVTRQGQVLSSFTGTADVTVQEAEHKIHESLSAGGVPIRLDYVLPGKELFRGSVDVLAGRFSVEFVVPRRCHSGPDARIRTYVASQDMDGVGACDTLRIVQAETPRPDLEPPSVHVYFSGQATKVKAGARLIADISDPDGIAILGTEPQSSIFLEFDGSGFPVYVTDYFTYDHGSYTSGRVEYPLSEGFESGPHTVMIKAFDNLGLSASDTLRFEIVEEGLYEVSNVLNLPNPFSKSTNFIFQVTNPAEARLTIFTVSGIRIWERRISALEGFNSIYWDGRDDAGDRIANGTYLYVLEVDFKDSFHRTETVRGKAVLLK
jgi:hypothetical protein